MLRSFFTLTTVLALAVFASLWAASPAAAEQGSWYSGTDGYGRSTSPSWSGGYSGSSGYLTTSYYSVTYSAGPAYDPVAPTYSYVTPTYYSAPVYFYTEPTWSYTTSVYYSAPAPVYYFASEVIR
jgi:hypothetical protein